MNHRKLLLVSSILGAGVMSEMAACGDSAGENATASSGADAAIEGSSVGTGSDAASLGDAASLDEPLADGTVIEDQVLSEASADSASDGATAADAPVCPAPPFDVALSPPVSGMDSPPQVANLVVDAEGRVCPTSTYASASLQLSWSTPSGLLDVAGQPTWTIAAASAGTYSDGGGGAVGNVPLDSDVTVTLTNASGAAVALTFLVHVNSDGSGYVDVVSVAPISPDATAPN